METAIDPITTKMKNNQKQTTLLRSWLSAWILRDLSKEEKTSAELDSLSIFMIHFK